ncbi:MAG: ribbon-helix-helix protein, CopG family [Leptolyngbyaceae cyanobacterium SM1_3_5]|nr:ribbon-helix-helix protein, CopG family [Leptolyngbyaceae cyanobacterium SM1_3_5]
MTTDKARLNVYIPQQLKEQFDRLAQQERRSLSVTVEILRMQVAKNMQFQAIR